MASINRDRVCGHLHCCLLAQWTHSHTRNGTPLTHACTPFVVLATIFLKKYALMLCCQMIEKYFALDGVESGELLVSIRRSALTSPFLQEIVLVLIIAKLSSPCLIGIVACVTVSFIVCCRCNVHSLYRWNACGLVCCVHLLHQKLSKKEGPLTKSLLKSFGIGLEHLLGDEPLSVQKSQASDVLSANPALLHLKNMASQRKLSLQVPTLLVYMTYISVIVFRVTSVFNAAQFP